MDKLNQQLKAYVECQDTINHQLLELERSLVTSEQEITMLQSSLIEIQNERSVLRNLLEQERMKRQEYEELVSNGKAKEKATFDQLKTLLKEKASLATKLNEANVRLAHLNSRSPLRASKILLDVTKRESNAGSSKERIVLSDASCGDESICEQTVVEEASREDGNLDGNLLKYFNIDE
jgi:chromosome segregation ATPase